MNTDAFIIYVIDRSGSMNGREEATCEGFNGFMAEQKKIDGKCLVSVMLFDNYLDILCVAENAHKLPKMSTKPGKLRYTLGGSTALRDAIGAAIKGGEAWLKNHDFDGTTYLCVITDGYENASTQFTPSQIRSLIAEKEAAGWQIIFQGGDQSWLQAADLGFQPQNTFQYDNTSIGTAATYTASANFVSSTRTGS